MTAKIKDFGDHVNIFDGNAAIKIDLIKRKYHLFLDPKEQRLDVIKRFSAILKYYGYKIDGFTS